MRLGAVQAGDSVVAGRYRARIVAVGRDVVIDQRGALWRREDGRGVSRPSLQASVLVRERVHG